MCTAPNISPNSPQVTKTEGEAKCAALLAGEGIIIRASNEVLFNNQVIHHTHCLVSSLNFSSSDLLIALLQSLTTDTFSACMGVEEPENTLNTVGIQAPNYLAIIHECTSQALHGYSLEIPGSHSVLTPQHNYLEATRRKERN